MSIREILARHIEPEAIASLQKLLRVIDPVTGEEDKEPPVEAIDVVRAVAFAHIHHIKFHAERLTELATLLAATLRDPRRAFHGGQLNVAMMLIARLVGTTARVCVDQILTEDEPIAAGASPHN